SGAGGSGAGGDATPCTVHVPGDYADLGTAFAALAPTGGKICVTAPVPGGTLHAVPDGTPPLEVEGFGRDAPDNTMTIDVDGYTPGLFVHDITLEGLGVDAATVTIARARLATSTLGGGVLAVDDRNGPTHVVVDACELTNEAVALQQLGTEGAALVHPWGNTPGELLRIQNSWIHDANTGVCYYQPTVPADLAHDAVVLVNDTFTTDTYGAYFTVRDPSHGFPITVANDVFAGSMNVAVSISELTAVSYLTVSHDAYWQNGTNFYGAVPPGPGFVSSDPKLDMQSPPAPGAGSPLVGAADPAYAPVADFEGAARGGSPDIGARER
ncbi:MAG TPA: hypothetical protein VHB21_15990, partial [Minicystis sp.]|nr:hypothetical protein [Minicystis sp.]